MLFDFTLIVFDHNFEPVFTLKKPAQNRLNICLILLLMLNWCHLMLFWFESWWFDWCNFDVILMFQKNNRKNFRFFCFFNDSFDVIVMVKWCHFLMLFWWYFDVKMMLFWCSNDVILMLKWFRISLVKVLNLRGYI